MSEETKKKILPITLIGKSVRTVDSSSGVDVTDIVSYMYPDFEKRNEILFDKDNKIIYTGKYYAGVKKDLEEGTKDFIEICNIGIQDIDLTDRDIMINILYSKFGKEPREEVKETLNSLSDVDFSNYFKKFWVSGRSKLESSEYSLFDLYNTLGGQRHDILKCYFQLSETYSDTYIFSGVLSFIEKALNPDMVSSQSGRYLKLLSNFRNLYKNTARQVVRQAYTMKVRTKEDKRYRTLWLLMQFGKGVMI